MHDGGVEILVVRCPRANIVEKVRAESGRIVSSDGSRLSDSYIGRLNLGVSAVVEYVDHLRGLFVVTHGAPYPLLAISKFREFLIQLCVALSSFFESLILNIENLLKCKNEVLAYGSIWKDVTSLSNDL